MKYYSLFIVILLIVSIIFSEIVFAITPNDPQWTSPDAGLRWGQVYIGLPSAWDFTTGIKGIKIGIIDEGFDIGHEDLKDNINLNLSVVKRADEHGTHVAGIIGAKGNNGIGVAGIMWDTDLLLYDDMRIPFTNFILAFKAMRRMEDAIRNEAKVINYSIGRDHCISGYCSETSAQLENGAWKIILLDRFKENVVFVFAAGERGGDDKYSSPSSLSKEYNNIVSVTASDQLGKLDYGANYGDISVAAPGTQIYSTAPNDNYVFNAGTSFAVPFVTGLAGLIWSKAEELGKTLTAAEVKDLIIQGAVKGNKFVSGPDNKQIPIINAYESLKRLVGPPTPQLGTDILLYYGNGGIDFTFLKLKEFYENKGINTTFTDVFPNDLSTFKLIILLESGALDDTGINFFTPQQISAFENFLLNGNRLVILGEVGAYCLNTVNKLLQDLNIDIQKNDSNAIPGRESSPMTDITDDQITNGVDGILFSAAADLEVDGDAKSLVRENTSGVHLIAVDHFNGAPSRPGGDVVVSGNGSFFDNSTNRGILVLPHQILAENLYNFGE